MLTTKQIVVVLATIIIIAICPFLTNSETVVVKEITKPRIVVLRIEPQITEEVTEVREYYYTEESVLPTTEAPVITPQDPLPPPTGTTEEPVDETGMQVYFYKGGELASVPYVPPIGGQMVEYTIIKLLEGPTAEQVEEGYTTCIPAGVKFRYSQILDDNSEYTVCLTEELLLLQGKPEIAQKALAQLEWTIKEAAGVEQVTITIKPINGPLVDAYEALGLN